MKTRRIAGKIILAISLAAFAVHVALFLSQSRHCSFSTVADAVQHLRGLLALSGVAIGAALLGTRELALVLRLYLGILFIYSSAENLLNPQPFATAVDHYRILPRVTVNSFAIVLAWVEFATGCFLVLGLFARSAGLLSTLMYCMFAIAIASAVARGLDISCGCFNLNAASKASADKVSWAHVAWRVFGMALSVIILRFSRFTDWPAALLIKRGS